MSGVFHGGGLDATIAEYGGDREAWLDLSAGINPNAYPVGDLPEHIWQRLPDINAENALIEAARNYYQVRDNYSLVAAPGTQAIIELLPSLLNAKQVNVLSPTYGEHAHCWIKAGANVSLISSMETESEADVLVVVNPNNPTGEMHSIDALLETANRVRFMIVDEAFCDSNPKISVVPTLPDNVIVLKSFGKFFGLAGLRLGFAICNSAIAEMLERRLGPWAVSGPALAIGARAFADENWISKTCQDLATRSDELVSMLKQNGFGIEGSNPLFVYAKHQNSQAMYSHLCENHILVRRFPEREGYLRFGLCKDDAELSRLEEALKSYE